MSYEVLKSGTMGERSGEHDVYPLSNFRKAANLATVFALGLSACSPREIRVLVEPKGEPVPATETIPPTEIPTPTPIESPTSTETPKIDEHDLEPNYIQETSVEFMGVQIKAQLITDKSLDPSITKVTVPDNVYAEFIARTIFKTWWKKGNEPHTGIPTEDDFRAFMALWATAQETNNPADWEKVQINEIWANDLNDGNGYEQAPYTIWPMFEGETPEGVKGINRIGYVFAKSNQLENITIFDNNAYGVGYGTNIDDNTFYVYGGKASGSTNVSSVASGMSSVSFWLTRNSGGSYSGYGSEDGVLINLLINGGLTLFP